MYTLGSRAHDARDLGAGHIGQWWLVLVEPTRLKRIGKCDPGGADVDDHDTRAGGLVVFGAGTVGLLVVMGATIAGYATIVAVDPVAEHRSLAMELGATAAVDPTTGDTAAQLRDITAGGPTAAVDTTALPDVIATALTVLRARGTLALVGLGALSSELPVGLAMAKGLDVRGVVEGDSVRTRSFRSSPTSGAAVSCRWIGW